MHMLKSEVADKMRELITPMQGSRMLEIGTGWGESAAFLSSLKPNWHIYTVDGYGLYGDGRIYSEWNHEKIKHVVDSLPINVIQILGNSSTMPWELPIDVLFIDGDHSFKGCRKDYLNYSAFVRSGGFIIFDDYHQDNNPNNGVKSVVRQILECEPDIYEMAYEGYYCAILLKL